ncbi:MAG TPA: hypothetical protein VIG74_03740 [Alphaproteobacteria bacterium]|jgi:hypothetical protein
MFKSAEKNIAALLLAFTAGCTAAPAIQVEQPPQPIRGANCPQLQKDYIIAADKLYGIAEQTKSIPKPEAIQQIIEASRHSRQLYYKARQDMEYGNCDFNEFIEHHHALNTKLLQRSSEINEYWLKL